MRRRRRERPMVYVLIAIALVVFAIGVVYLITLPRDLPSFLPGHVHARTAAAAASKSTAHYGKRAAMAFIVSAAVFLLAVSQSWTWRRWRRYH